MRIIKFFEAIGEFVISLFSFIIDFVKKKKNVNTKTKKRNVIIAFFEKVGDITLFLFILPFRLAHHFNRIFIRGGKKVAVLRRTNYFFLDILIFYHYKAVNTLEKLDDFLWYERKFLFFKRKDLPKRYRSLIGIVKSKGEKRIANWLYLQGIKVYYEKDRLYFKEENKASVPDFKLPEFGIYIEFWGMEGAFDYTERREYKERLYKKYNIKYVGLFPEDVQNAKVMDEELPKKIAVVSGKTIKIRRWKNDYMKLL